MVRYALSFCGFLLLAASCGPLPGPAAAPDVPSGIVYDNLPEADAAPGDAAAPAAKAAARPPLNVADNDEGVPRDLTLQFAAGAAPMHIPWSLVIAGPEGWVLPFTTTAEPPALRPLEVPPAWSQLNLRIDETAYLSWTVGSDLTEDPPRIVAHEPPAGQPVGSGQALELRFGRRLATTELPELAGICAGGAADLRWHWVRGGARARVEPRSFWPEGPCTLAISGLRPQDGGPTADLTVGPFDVAATRRRVRLSEVVVDPQLDWSDDGGSPFDAIPGAGTVSSNDEFIELVNASGNPVDLRGWRVEMLDGTDEALVFGDSGSTPIRVTPPWADIAALPPCGVVVIGNPPGQLNNEIVLRLARPDGTLEDRMHLSGSTAFAGLPGTLARTGGGKSSSPADEAVFPLWTTGDGAPLVQGAATPSVAPCDP